MIKNQVKFYALFTIILLLISCKNDKVDSGRTYTQRTEAFELLNTKFESGAILQSVSVGVDKTIINFLDNTKTDLDNKALTVVSCTPTTWPRVSLNSSNEWNVGNVNTEVVNDATKSAVVAVIYDTKSLYVCLQSGKMLFFTFSQPQEIGVFKFEASKNTNLSQDIPCTIEGDVVSANLPVGISPNGLIATIAYRGKSLKIGDIAQFSGVTPNNFSTPITYTYETFAGTQKSLTVKVVGFKNIPVIHIATTGSQPIISKDDYITATIKIEDPDLLYSDKQIVELPTEIRGRGNSTWGMDKKPYKIKLSKKARLLGMTEDKEWALLAMYSDKSLLRDFTAYKISRIVGMPWTPDSRFVELHINGSYNGIYMLTEQVKVSGERVNIDIVKTGDNTGSALTGGYFLEVDERHDSDTWFDTAHGLAVVFKEPKIPTADQLQYVKDYFRLAEESMYATNFADPVHGYAKYIDVESFVANYIIQELTKNIDGNMRLSNFLTKTRDGKIAHSNVWDFDIALGNCNYFNSESMGNGPQGFWIKNGRWYKKLLADPGFKHKVRIAWSSLYPQLERVISDMEQTAVQIDPAQQRNYKRWPTLNTMLWPNVYALGTYKAEKQYMIDFLTIRAAWLDSQFKTW